MKIDIKNLPKSAEDLKDIILSLHQSFSETQIKLTEKENELSSFKSKYENLLEQFKLAKQQRFGAKSESNLAQPDMFDEAGVDLSCEVKEQLTEQSDDETAVAGHMRKKHPVRKRLPQDLPREVIIHDITENETHCGCGCRLTKIGEEITEQLKYIPAELSVVQYVRPKYACKSCQETVKIAPMPILLLPKCIATPELVAQTIIAKYCDHLPLYRQEKIWERLGIDLPRNSLCGWILKVAQLCEPLIVQMKKIITGYELVQADETTVQVLNEKDRENTTKSYMWCYRGGGEDELCIV